MRHIFLSSLLILLALGFSVNDATAGRFGGGRGFGGMRSNAFSHARPLHATAAKNVNTHKTRNLLTGLVVGGLLAHLFMGHGFGGALLSWFLLGMALLLVMRLVKRKKCDHSNCHIDH